MNITTIAKQLNLGEIIDECTPLIGGALHSMFKLKTSTGTYAVKKINSHIAEKKNFQQIYELSEKIAEHMLQAKIPAVCSLVFDGMHVIQVETEYFIIYPFVEGKLLDDKSLTPDHAQRIGSLYASIHRNEFALSDIDKAHYDYFDENHWDTLIRKTQQPSLIELLPSIFYWNQAYTESITELNKELVITHRDMHSQNVLWSKHNHPYIIDWESAGLMNPMLEIIGYGLEWSGIILQQNVNIPFFKTLITTYFQNLTHYWHTTPKQAFTGWLGHCVLAWTEFNIRRMLGKVSSHNSEIKKGREIIENKMLPCLNFIKQNEQDLIFLIEQNMAKPTDLK